MANLQARAKRSLPGWLRLILMVWGISLLLLVVLQLALGLTSLVVG